jgi:hypothetical protein
VTVGSKSTKTKLLNDGATDAELKIRYEKWQHGSKEIEVGSVKKSRRTEGCILAASQCTHTDKRPF